MNVRALALGALVGFVVAFAPSCSPAKCGPQNCDGCCDTKGTCVKKPNNNNNTTCGSAGNACVDCAAASSTCNPSTSTCGSTGAGGGTGGGTGGGGGTCDGCSLPSGNCVSLSRTSVNNCGVNGAACGACVTGELCTNGACVVPISAKKVGAPCSSDMECQGTGPTALGPTAICKQMTTTGNGTYTNGYCTLRCGTAANQCPSGSACVGLLPAYGEGDTICWDNCSTSDPCRNPGYRCYDLTTVTACWISPIPPIDAGVPADKVGNACADTSTCVNPPETGGVCLSREFNYNWTAVGGYCSKDSCISNAECSPDGGAFCIGLGSGDNDPSVCVQRCADSSDAGQSSCRNGYRCEQYFTGLPDGGQQPSVDGFCVPPLAPIPSSIGDQCANDTACSVPTGAIADCFPPTLVDGGASGFTDGYCTRFDCSVDDDCSEDGGASCFSTGANSSACFRNCAVAGAGQSTCRTGYVCQSFGIADGGQSSSGLCDRACNAPGVPGCATGQTCNTTTGYCM